MRKYKLIKKYPGSPELGNLVYQDDKYSCGTYLKDLKKIKQPLFTTEDGVDIFEGEKYKKLFIIPKNTFTIKECNKHIIREPFPFSKNAKYFSTKEAAEEYILYNKPCLSIQDVVNKFCLDFEQEDLWLSIELLKNLVKSKNK